MRAISILFLIGLLSGCYSPDDMVRDAFDLVGDTYYDEVVAPIYNEPQTSKVSEERMELVYYYVDTVSSEMEDMYDIDMSDIDILFNLNHDPYDGYAHVLLFGYGNIIQFDPEYVGRASERNVWKLVVHELAHIANAKMNWLRALENTHGCSFQHILVDFGIEPSNGHREKVCF